DLISASALLRSRGRIFHCSIIGEGPLEESLRAQIAAAELKDFVALTGPQTQAAIAKRLAHAAVFALPCTHEADGGMDNLPTVIMEAMAAGLPVISTPLCRRKHRCRPVGASYGDRAPPLQEFPDAIHRPQINAVRSTAHELFANQTHHVVLSRRHSAGAFSRGDVEQVSIRRVLDDEL